MADGFLGRWAKRKNDVLQGKAVEEPSLAPLPAPSSARPGAASSGTSASDLAKRQAQGQGGAGASTQALDGQATSPAADAPPLTLDDVQGLTKDSDFKPFMNKAVEPGVRNAAMKKLFTDPHFNVMDRMDIYIDDYSQPDPLPAAMLRQMASAKFLKLFDDEEDKADPADPENAPVADAEASNANATDNANANANDNAQATAAEPDRLAAHADPASADISSADLSAAEPSPHQDPHAHPDLRLQPDHAAERPEPGRGAA